MATAINVNAGKMPSAPVRIIQADVTFASVNPYRSGGASDTTLAAALTGLTYRSVAQAAHNGTHVRWFKVDHSTDKVRAYADAACKTEATSSATTTGVDLSAFTVIPVLIVAE